MVQLGVIEMMRGNSEGDTTGGAWGSCDDDATGGEVCGVILGRGGMSHGRGMRLSKDGTVIFLTGGNGTLSDC